MFRGVDPAGAVAAAGIADGDALLAIDGTELTPALALIAGEFILYTSEPYVARVRSKSASEAIDLKVTPQ